jgi:hypothetical protein
MPDVLYIGIALSFFGLSLGYLEFLDRAVR